MWLYTLNTRILGRFLGLYWRLALRGATDSIPDGSPILLTANHSSFLDPWFIAMAFPRPVRFLINSNWYYRNAAWNYVFESYGTIPVCANQPGGTIDRLCDALENGDVVGVFPEGRISADGNLQRFRSGVARIAARTGFPVMPLGIRGAHESLPRTRHFPKPTKVTIHAGEPIHFPGAPLLGDPLPSQIFEFNRILRAETARLKGVEDPSIGAVRVSRAS